MPDDNGVFDYIMFKETSNSGGGDGGKNSPGCLTWIVLTAVVYIIFKLFGD